MGGRQSTLGWGAALRAHSPDHRMLDRVSHPPPTPAPTWLRSGRHVSELCASLAPPGGPQSPAALPGRAAALPLLLAGVLPQCEAPALQACLRRLCWDAGTGEVRLLWGVGQEGWGGEWDRRGWDRRGGTGGVGRRGGGGELDATLCCICWRCRWNCHSS